MQRSLIFSICTGLAGGLAASPPNILFIAVDDLKPALGVYGDELAKTPLLDSLAEQGAFWQRAYCQQAVSAPSRVSLMTGMRPDYTGVWDLQTQMRDVRPDILTMPAHFAAHGYETTGIGKVFDFRSVDRQLDAPSWTRPFERVRNEYYYQSQPPALNWYQEESNRIEAERLLQEAADQGLSGWPATRYALQHLRPSVEAADVPDHAYTDGAVTLQAIDILRELAQNDKPFFLAVGYDRPHLPFAVPLKYWEIYDSEEIPLAEFRKRARNSPAIAYHNSGELREYTDIPPLATVPHHEGGIGLPLDKQLELIHGYYASVSYIDALVGMLVEELQHLELSNNTIIVIWGDHGFHLGDHDLWCKHSNFEQAAWSPLIITAPGYQNGKVSDVVELLDVFPTLCELSGIPVPEHLEGVSLEPQIKNPEHQVKEFAISQFPRGEEIMGYSIRTERYRLTYWMTDGFRTDQPFNKKIIMAKELYDYQRDPLETRNMAGRLLYRRTERKMDAMIQNFFHTKYKEYNQ